MPILGAEMESGRLTEWRVHPGDRVKRGDIIAVVDTDKAAIEVEIWDDGEVTELLVQPGESVHVGTVIARLEVTESSAAPKPAAAEPALVAKAPPGQPAPHPASHTALVATPGETRGRASPAARRLAEERGLDLATVTGSGLDGAITREDVEHAIAQPAPAATRDRQDAMRRAIGAAMARSKREIPHYYLERAVVMDRALEFLRRENERRPVTERLLPVVLQIKAVALALRETPELNGHWVDGALRPSASVNAGVAITLRPSGLVAPALHAVETKDLQQLMREFTDLAARARLGSLRSSELGEGTITVNGLGDRGADVVHAVVYPPQVAIVGFGRVHECAWSEAGVPLSRQICRVSLAADHRASDGHRGSLFLDALDRALQEPEML